MQCMFAFQMLSSVSTLLASASKQDLTSLFDLLKQASAIVETNIVRQSGYTHLHVTLPLPCASKRRKIRLQQACRL